MKIIQITTYLSGSVYDIFSEIYGLGDDNKVYYWSAKTGEWKLFVRE
jgi:hypothetical protein